MVRKMSSDAEVTVFRTLGVISDSADGDMTIGKAKAKSGLASTMHGGAVNPTEKDEVNYCVATEGIGKEMCGLGMVKVAAMI